MRTRYIIDLDYTLLDTSRFKQDLAALFDLQGDELSASWQDSGGSAHYNPWQHARLLGHSDHHDSAINTLCAHTSQYLFPGVINWLTQLDGSRQLLTRGDTRLQQAKVKGSGLEALFQIIQITEGDKAAALADTPQDQWVLVNDSAMELEALTLAYPQARVICLLGPYSSKENLPWPVHDPHVFYNKACQS